MDDLIGRDKITKGELKTLLLHSQADEIRISGLCVCVCVCVCMCVCMCVCVFVGKTEIDRDSSAWLIIMSQTGSYHCHFKVFFFF